METLNLSIPDRMRIDALTDELEKYNNKHSDVLISCKEAARLLHKNPVTISKMIHDGRLTKITIGKSTGIRLSDVWEQAAGMR